MAKIKFKRNFKLGRNETPSEIIKEGNAKLSITPGTIYYNGVFTTISYLNEKSYFTNIEKNRNLNDRRDNSSYYPQLPFNELEDMLNYSINTDEFNKKLDVINKYIELFDYNNNKEYYGGNLSNMPYDADKFENISDEVEKFAFAFVHNVPDNFEAYLNIRGILVNMKKSESSKNDDGTYNYIIEYPDYLLKKYKENYDSVISVKFENYKNGKYFPYKIFNIDDTKTYGSNVAPLNLIQ